MRNDQPETIYLKDYTPPGFLVDRVRLTFDLGDPVTTVTNEAWYKRNQDLPDGPATLQLYGNLSGTPDVWLDDVAVAGERLHIRDGVLSIRDVPDSFCLRVVTRLEPAKNTTLEGLYQSGGKFCTQCEPEGFRRITWYPDRPDVMAVFETRIIGDRSIYPVMLSNGNLVDQGELEGGRHFTLWDDPHPKPSYLFALVAGQLEAREDRFTTASGREVALKIFVEKEDLDKCDHAMTSLKQSMKWDEEVYGLEYDLDVFMIVAVSDFNMGAMENKGLNIFNSKCVLANTRTATDHDFFNIQAVIGHEYFHNWSGNRVTCRDWFQLSLKEGLTVFREQEFSADYNTRSVCRISDVAILRGGQFPEDAGPMAHAVRPASYIEINNFYTATVYEKGAEVIRMIRTIIGADAFRRGSDLYFNRHDGQAVTTDDFVRCMEEASGQDLAQFSRWYHQAGTPLVTARSRWDGANSTLTLSLQQMIPDTPGQKNKKPHVIPLSIALLDEEGRHQPLQAEGMTLSRDGDDAVLLLDSGTSQVSFAGLKSRPVVSLLRGFSAPVHLDIDLDTADLQTLLAHDNDGFNRYEAGQKLAIDSIKTLASGWDGPEPDSLDAGYVEAFRQLLTDTTTDPRIIACVLQVPDMEYLVNLEKEVHLESLHTGRRRLQLLLAGALRSEFHGVYQAHRDTSPYSPDGPGVGRRALKNSCLRYLCAGGERQHLDLAVRQYQESNNMTDTLAALAIIADHEIPERRALLDDFYRKWHHDPLVLDKWYAVQAGSGLRSDARNAG